MTPIRVGIAGLGRWGANYVAAIRRAGGDVVKAFRIQATLRGDPRLSGVEEASDIVSLMEGIDALVVAGPPGARSGAMRAASARGLPMMVEKPLAVGLGETSVLVRVASDSRAPFLVNHQHLFAPAYEALRSEVLGRSRTGLRVESSGQGPGPFRPYSSLWDYGPHDASMLFGLGLELVDCSATATREVSGGMTFRIEARYGRDRLSLSTTGNGAKTKERLFSVSCGSFCAVYDDMSPTKLVVDGKPLDVGPDLPLDRSVAAFLEAVRTGKTDWRFGASAPSWVGAFLDSAQRSCSSDL